MKKDFLYFLFESTEQLKLRRHLLLSLKFQFKQSHLCKLFMGFIQYRIYNLKKRNLLAMATDVNNTFLKKRVVKGLTWNIEIQNYLKRRSIINAQRLKSECLLLLRYSTTKTKLLRDTYYDYVVNKSRCLASQTLQLWLSKSIRKIVSRDHLQHKIEHFQKRRFFITLNGIKARKDTSLNIINHCQALKWKRVFS